MYKLKIIVFSRFLRITVTEDCVLFVTFGGYLIYNRGQNRNPSQEILKLISKSLDALLDLLMSDKFINHGVKSNKCYSYCKSPMTWVPHFVQLLTVF